MKQIDTDNIQVHEDIDFTRALNIVLGTFSIANENFQSSDVKQKLDYVRTLLIHTMHNRDFLEKLNKKLKTIGELNNKLNEGGFKL